VVHGHRHPPGKLVDAVPAPTGRLPLGDGHHSGGHLLDPLQEGGELVGPAQLVQEHDAVHGQGLVRVQLQCRCGSCGIRSRGGARDGVMVVVGVGGAAAEEERREAEGEVDGSGEGAQAGAGTKERVTVSAGAGDSDLGRRAACGGAVGDRLEERRPLHAVRGVEVEDVDAARAVNGVEDGLVRRKVREPQERRDLIEGQVRARRGWRARRGMGVGA
jgi:hypothetical protein